MGRDTGIQWCNDTVNPTSGCDGCELFIKPLPELTGDALRAWERKQPCYASHVHQNRLAHSFPEKYAKSFGEVRLIPGRLQKCANWPDLTGKQDPEKPWLAGLPRMIFISDMADALSEAVPFEYLRDEIILPVISWQKNRHIGMWLTKRPERMVEFAAWLDNQGIPWPSNLWAGTSATTQATADKRITHLLNMPLGCVLFVSGEPQRSPIIPKKCRRVCDNGCGYEIVTDNPMGHWGGSYGWRDGARASTYCPKCGWSLREVSRISLYIIGGESGANPHELNVAWVRDLLAQFEHVAARFVKQLGANPITVGAAGEKQTLALEDGHGGDWNEWPEDLRVREMPEVRT